MPDKDFKNFVSHFSATVSPEIVNFATNVAFLWSRYIFTRREGKKQFGYCTHCRKECETKGLRQGEMATCELCGSECRVRASGRGRKRMIDEVYFVYYEKSLVNPEAITARGIFAVRDYRDDYRCVETQFEVKAMYLFESGNSVLYERPWLYYSETSGMWSKQNWQLHKTVSSLAKGVMQFKASYCSLESIAAAVQGTPFQYSTWEQYQDGDMVKFFDLAAKYPCIEYLTKLGFRGLVEARLHGDRTFGVVNWRGKNPLSVLRITKQEMRELQSLTTRVDPWLLYLRGVSKRDGSNLSWSELQQIYNGLSTSYRNELDEALSHTSLRKLMAYLSKQLNKEDVRKYYSSLSRLLDTWNDYLGDCERLQLNIADEAIKFPSNLYRAHQNTIKQIKIKADELLNAKIAERCKALKKFRFESPGFLLRPAESSQELIEEGKALHHCVGTYADRYAKGEADIFVLRRIDEPDKPFYTVEIRGGHINQCRGFKNCVPTDEVKAFIELFVGKKLLTKKTD